MAEHRTTVCVGVSPARERSARRRLFAALEELYPVRFEGREDGDWDGLDGLLVVGRSALAPTPGGLPRLQALGEEQSQGCPRVLTLAENAALEQPLRGARLSDAWTGRPAAGVFAAGDLQLATADGVPLWIARGDQARQQVVATAPAELAADEALRERLTPGRCLALLALTNFLRSLLRGRAQQEPSLSAAFVLDDPNLHWPSYGHLRYDELSSHALDHGYHLAVAMVPLDGWLTHPRVVRIFNERAEQLSVCIHGNDHEGPELGRVASEGAGVALAGQALARAGAFQRRTGIPVERVMIPPHEQLSEPAAHGLLACGYDAVCVSRPYPWIVAPPERQQFAAPPGRASLVGWRSPEMVAGGLPLLLRAGFNAPREDLVLRAFLGQPLILYGHHDVLKNGLDVLAEAAAAINTLGEVRWSSLASIVRSAAVSGEARGRAATPGSPVDALAPRRRLAPLLRRLASEGRDRAQALRPPAASRR